MIPISVVIPTYNRLPQLRRVLTALERQQYPMEQFEVIVVSDGSADNTDQYLQNLHTPLRLTPIRQANQGVSVARNNGWQHADGKLILFLDDDVAPAPQLIDEHVRLHNDENTVVLGPMLTPPDFPLSPWVRWEQKMLLKQYQDMTAGKWEPTARQFYTGNTSLSRQSISQLGGFDPAFRRAEDVELAYRLAAQGTRFIFNPDAIGYHYVKRSFASWLAIPYAYGRNDVIFTQEKGQTWLLPSIWREFHRRHPVTREVMRLCLDRPVLSKIALSMMRRAASIGNNLNIQSLPRMAYSGIFNLRHYQGIVDELGGRDRFFDGVAQEANAV